MNTSVAALVRDVIERAPDRSFVRVGEVPAAAGPTELAFSRLARAGRYGLHRVRKGVYWKPRMTRFGPVLPRPEEIAAVIAGAGSGPAGVAAASALGVTTQVPGTVQYAVPGRAPSALHGVRFCQRGYHRREVGLRPLEVAVLEVLREPRVVEVSFEELVATVQRFVASDEVRIEALRTAAEREHHAVTRTRFIELERGLMHEPA